MRAGISRGASREICNPAAEIISQNPREATLASTLCQEEKYAAYNWDNLPGNHRRIITGDSSDITHSAKKYKKIIHTATFSSRQGAIGLARQLVVRAQPRETHAANVLSRKERLRAAPERYRASASSLASCTSFFRASILDSSSLRWSRLSS